MIFDRRNGHSSQEEHPQAGSDGGGDMSDRHKPPPEKKPNGDDRRAFLKIEFGSKGMERAGLAVTVAALAALALKILEMWSQ